MSDRGSCIVKKEGSVLKIVLSSSLDKRNADGLLETIRTQLDDEIKSIVFDATDLRHISADGLDVILELKKKYKNITIDNARMGICDILSLYGFDHFVDINKQYRFLSVKDSELIGEGGHGAIYRVGEDTLVKVYKDSSTLEIIENERRYAKNAFVNGIPSAIAYDVVQTEYGYGVVLEMIDGTTLGKYLLEHPDELEECSIKFADLLYKLNHTEADPDLYDDFHDVYLGRAEKAGEWGYITREEVDTMQRIIRSIPRGTGMIHGDYHPNNVMITSGGELLLIDMADISRGNPFFDVGGSYLIMESMPQKFYMKKMTQRITSLPPETCIKMWDIFMRRYYKTDDEAVLEKYKEQFKAFSQLRIATSLGMKSSRSDFMTKVLRLYTKRVILPKADEMIKVFSECS